MKDRPPTLSAVELRRRAEARLRKRQRTQRSTSKGQKSTADTQRLVHELEVHQIELEMQNAELQAAREEVEAALEKYSDLYEFAPVGYLSIDNHGFILEANLRATVLFGVDRSRLLKHSLQHFVPAASQAVYHNFLEKVFAGSGKQSCEVAMETATGGKFWADLQGASATVRTNMHPRCRVVVTDITVRKQGEEAQRRAAALATLNRDLRREIVRRQAVEKALQKSEQHQIHLLAQSLRQQEELRHLSHQILHAQEEERKRISRELHDDIAQTLVGISVHLHTLVRASAINPKALKQEAARTQRLVEKSVKIVQEFAMKLRPTLLDDLGLITGLQYFLKDFTKQTGIRVSFTTFAKAERLSSDCRTALYRVTQEALTNVARHAHASRVDISIKKTPRAVVLTIRDNGQSFPVEPVLHAKGKKPLGLIGMRERVEMLGGKFSVESTPGHGTAIRAQIPLTNGQRR
jgi:PAS domain S-box-containing protein